MQIFHYSFMWPALVACTILAGIHTYFGYHVVRRGVIFVDLSLSQIAALGTSVALLFGWGENAPAQTYIMSLGFTLAGAVLFAVLRKSKNIVPLEALIGITYAGAIAISLLVLEKSATGTEHIKEMLVGTILTVSWHDTLQLGLVAGAVGIAHFLLRKTFFLISENPEVAENKSLKLWWWDIIFYATFGIVVTSSVKIAGVLLIFSLLIIPAVAAALNVSKAMHRVIFGWLFGTIGCLLGLEMSLRFDCAAGPAVIGTMLVLLLLCAAGHFLHLARP